MTRRTIAARPMRPTKKAPTDGARTARGLATQAALVRAARKVFERDGFLDARITDITARARTATGSFYTYFENKEEIFTAVVEGLEEEDMLHLPSLDYLAEEETNPVARIADHHRAYLESYLRNARLMSVMEQVTNISDDFRRQRTARAQTYVNRNAAAIRRLQEAGRADPALDPLTTSRALSTMVSRAAYVTFILEEERSIEQLVETLTRLWVNALKIPVDEAELDALHPSVHRPAT